MKDKHYELEKILFLQSLGQDAYLDSPDYKLINRKPVTKLRKTINETLVISSTGILGYILANKAFSFINDIKQIKKTSDSLSELIKYNIISEEANPKNLEGLMIYSSYMKSLNLSNESKASFQQIINGIIQANKLQDTTNRNYLLIESRDKIIEIKNYEKENLSAWAISSFTLGSLIIFYACHRIAKNIYKKFHKNSV